MGSQMRLEVGPDEGTVDMLLEDRLVGHRQSLDLEGRIVEALLHVDEE
jgi:hypothetical protein